MPITLRKFNAQVKDPETGDMVPAGLLSSDSIEAIEEAGTAAVAAVESKQAVAEAAVELKGQTTLASIPADYTELSNEVDDVKTVLDNVTDALPLIGTASGNPAVVTDVKPGTTFKSLKVGIEPVQAGSGDPAPDNVRSISGWTGANVYVSPTSDPVDGETYSVTFPTEAGTVYGGVLDLTAGTLTVDTVYLELNSSMSIQAYAYSGKNGVFIGSLLPFSENRAKGVCSHSSSVGGSGTNAVWIGANNPHFYWIGILDVLGLSTVEEFKTWLGTQTVQIAYKLGNPANYSVYQLTPQQIAALAGLNNVWADCGPVELEYAKDETVEEMIVGELKTYVGEFDYKKLFEIGNYYTSNGEIIPFADGKCVRTKTFIDLSADDIIGLSDYTDAKYYLYKRTNGSWAADSSWKTSNFTVVDTASYCIVIANNTPTALTTSDDLASLFFTTHIFDTYSEINNNADNIEKTYELNLKWYDGYVNTTGNISPNVEKGAIHTEKIPTEYLDEYNIHVEFADTKPLVFYIGLYDEKGLFIKRIDITTGDSAYYVYNTNEKNDVVNAKYVAFSYYSYNNVTSSTVKISTKSRLNSIEKAVATLNKTTVLASNDNIISKTLGNNERINAPDRYPYCTAENITSFKKAAKAFMTAHAGDMNIIPLVVYTDMHIFTNQETGYKSKGVFNLISDILPKDEISSYISLGDIVSDHWEDDATYGLLKNTELEAFKEVTKSLPPEKRIDVMGNHDTWYVPTDADITFLPSLKYNSPYFNNSDRYKITSCPDNSGNMVIYDSYYMVKYVVVADWDYSVWDSSDPLAYFKAAVSTSHWNWIIKQLEIVDDYDIIILSHIPLLVNSQTSTNPFTNETTGVAGTGKFDYSDNKTNNDSEKLWVARKQKTSGTFTDLSGVDHEFNFTNCKGNLLMSIHGHQHKDEYQYLEYQNLEENIDDKLLQVVCAGMYANRKVYFLLIDRKNRTVNGWKWADNIAPDSAPASYHHELPLDAT